MKKLIDQDHYFTGFSSELIDCRVPVLKVTNGLELQIDVIVEGKGSHYKSAILGILLKKFRSLRILHPLIKSIFQSRWLNDARSGTFNSYSILLLCVFILQINNHIPPLALLLYNIPPDWIEDTETPHWGGFILDSDDLDPSFLSDIEQRCDRFLARPPTRCASVSYAQSRGYYPAPSYQHLNDTCEPKQLLADFFADLDRVLGGSPESNHGILDSNGFCQSMISPLLGDAMIMPDKLRSINFFLFLEDPFQCGFKYRDNTTRTFGFIARQKENLPPEMVYNETRGSASIEYLKDTVRQLKQLTAFLVSDVLSESLFDGSFGKGKKDRKKTSEEEVKARGLWELHAAVFTALFGVAELAKCYDKLVAKVFAQLGEGGEKEAGGPCNADGNIVQGVPNNDGVWGQGKGDHGTYGGNGDDNGKSDDGKASSEDHYRKEEDTEDNNSELEYSVSLKSEDFSDDETSMAHRFKTLMLSKDEDDDDNDNDYADKDKEAPRLSEYSSKVPSTSFSRSSAIAATPSKTALAHALSPIPGFWIRNSARKVSSALRPNEFTELANNALDLMSISYGYGAMSINVERALEQLWTLQQSIIRKMWERFYETVAAGLLREWAKKVDLNRHRTGGNSLFQDQRGEDDGKATYLGWESLFPDYFVEGKAKQDVLWSHFFPKVFRVCDYWTKADLLKKCGLQEKVNLLLLEP
uniref:Uncharacterized protein n=1 Tax=Polytomella parva TaxID=51329 RepID=A0A7S0YLX9_9CHLO